MPSSHPSHQPGSFEAWIRLQGETLGFDRVGITTADPLLEDGLRLEEWLAAGHQAGMAYMARRPGQRACPGELLPGARSVVMTLTRYQADISQETGAVAPIASYATRDDYHQVLKGQLKELALRIVTRVPGSLFRLAVDTAPLLERALAARAGLGWIGKSTNLINEQLGSQTLIGSIILDIELRPDAPAPTRCGTCTRCLEACPTHAFPAPYRLDARRCLAYWTIEHRGPAPPEIRDHQGPRLFGCDECLTACPFGHRIRRAPSPALPTDPDLAGADLATLIERGRARFKRTFGHSPVPRALKRGFLRNAASALAHAASPATPSGTGDGRRAAIEAMLEEADPAVREHAAWALGQIGATPSRHALARALQQETSPAVAAQILLALETGSSPIN